MADSTVTSFGVPLGNTRCKKCGNPPSETEIEMIDNKDGTRGAQLWCPTREGYKEHPYEV